MARRRLLGNRLEPVKRRLLRALLTVGCDRCGAKAQERCITSAGASVPFHAARVERLYHRYDVARRLSPAPKPGICGCGCGRDTTIAAKTDRRTGAVKGQPLQFIHGHSRYAKQQVAA
jgi:hypothetical protein